MLSSQTSRKQVGKSEKNLRIQNQEKCIQQPGKARSPGGGVGFFQQFTRQLIRPYGEADGPPSPETVLKRVNHIPASGCYDRKWPFLSFQELLRRT